MASSLTAENTDGLAPSKLPVFGDRQAGCAVLGVLMAEEMGLSLDDQRLREETEAYESCGPLGVVRNVLFSSRPFGGERILHANALAAAAAAAPTDNNSSGIGGNIDSSSFDDDEGDNANPKKHVSWNPAADDDKPTNDDKKEDAMDYVTAAVFGAKVSGHALSSASTHIYSPRESNTRARASLFSKSGIKSFASSSRRCIQKEQRARWRSSTLASHLPSSGPGAPFARSLFPAPLLMPFNSPRLAADGYLSLRKKQAILAGIVYVSKEGVQYKQGDLRSVPRTGWVLLHASFFTCGKGGYRGLVAQVMLKDDAPPTEADIMGFYPLLEPLTFFDSLEPTHAAVNIEEWYGGRDHKPLSVFQGYLDTQREKALEAANDGDGACYPPLLEPHYLRRLPCFPLPPASFDMVEFDDPTTGFSMMSKGCTNIEFDPQMAKYRLSMLSQHHEVCLLLIRPRTFPPFCSRLLLYVALCRKWSISHRGITLFTAVRFIRSPRTSAN